MAYGRNNEGDTKDDFRESLSPLTSSLKKDAVRASRSKSERGGNVYSCCSTTFHFLFGFSISSQLRAKKPRSQT